MLRKPILAILAFVLISPNSASAACAGADPAIASVPVTSVTPVGGVNQYHIAGTVVNRGNMTQASNVLQFVDISQSGQRLDAKTIPPLAPGKSFEFTYVALRSVEAGNGTTTLNFQLDMHQPSPPGSQDCDPTNDASALTF